eukprot:TRINITY_DN1545_c0_g2_i1.p1 TRINITY_DN1545_c0_g2~~TRINITY_DN1545_c0_g2_i1.p1  ORF type:complete len:1138 (+),score=349.38 TRINITY_DN1545_c0_g2_i1:40-3453(+)
MPCLHTGSSTPMLTAASGYEMDDLIVPPPRTDLGLAHSRSLDVGLHDRVQSLPPGPGGPQFRDDAPLKAAAPAGRVDGVLQWVSNEPGKAYGGACLMFVAVFVLWVALIMTLGQDFLPFESQVPLYLRSDTARERLDAVAQGKKRSDAAINMARVQLRRVSDRDVDNTEMTFELLWQPASGNVFSRRHLQTIIATERTVFESEGYATACLLEWPQEALAIQSRAVATGDPAADLLIESMNENRGPYTGACVPPDSMAWGCAHPDPATGCEAVGATPPGILDCRRTQGCSRPEHFEPLNMTFARMKLNQYAAVNPFDQAASPAARRAYGYVDSAFGAGTVVGRALRTRFRFGAPVADFANLQDDLPGQTKLIKEHIWKHFSGIVSDASTAELDLKWQGYGMTGQLTQEQLPKDGAFAMGSMIFVLVYAVCTLASVFTGVMGVGQIIMGFAPAYLLYYAVFQQRYFGVFNVLSIFIILGIGADNIFVMADAWRQSTGTAPERLAETWRRSAGALAVTSVTTMASFLSNAASSFPAIQTFGIFAALLVFVNFAAVVTYFTTVISFNHTRYESTPFCGGVWAAVIDLLVQPARATFSESVGGLHELELPLNGAPRPPPAASPPGRVSCFDRSLPEPTPPAALEGLGRVERFFHNKFAMFIIRWRAAIVLVFHVCVALLVYKAAQLTPDPNPPQFFPETSTYEAFYPELAAAFSRGGSVMALKQQFVWGFDAAEPIDRKGTRASSIEDRGEPRYSPHFNVAKAAECIIQICGAAEVPNEALGLGGVPEYPVTCPLRHFKQWFLAGKSPTLRDAAAAAGAWASLTRLDGGAAEAEAFLLHFGAFLNDDPRVHDAYKPLAFGDSVAGQPWDPAALRLFYGGAAAPVNFTLEVKERVVPRFIMATLKLTTDRTIDHVQGIEMFREWEAWWTQQYTTGHCRAAAEHAPGFQNTKGQYLGWDYFFVQEKLVGEAMFGIALSLGLAWVVLTVATRNVVLSSLAVLSITEIVVCVVAYAVCVGWKLGILESICFVMVPGMSVDYVAHLAEAYNHSPATNRHERVRDMLTKVGVSVLSGAFSTLGATLFLFFPTIVFFVKFGTFIFVTIVASLLFSLFNFAALMALVGPQEEDGSIAHLYRKCRGCCLPQ